MADDLLHDRLGNIQRNPGATLFVPLDGLDDVLFARWAHSGKSPDAVFSGNLLQVVHVVYVQLLVKQGDRLGAQSGDIE
ncbi:Uncharacterised protein [uncultured archaeon]|nr:Uncharacterised protein [uncultured archaeon]